jgi:hypothetical protein
MQAEETYQAILASGWSSQLSLMTDFDRLEKTNDTEKLSPEPARKPTSSLADAGEEAATVGFFAPKDHLPQSEMLERTTCKQNCQKYRGGTWSLPASTKDASVI